MWAALGEGPAPRHATSERLGEVGIRPFRTGYGVFVNKTETAHLAPAGVAQAVLHTGSSYDDDLTDDGLLYHYPDKPGRETKNANEVTALKAAGELGLPVFVVTGASGDRAVYLGWVRDSDDDRKLVLIEFGDTPEPAPAAPPPLDLDVERRRVRHNAVARPNQARFRMQVFKRYGVACAVCDVRAPELLEAAHLIAVEHGGPDHPENGIPLCANHHRALDRGLIGFDPDTLAIKGPLDDLGVTRFNLKHLPARPHPVALAEASKLYRT